MNLVPQPPIFLVDGNDVTAFPSVTAAEDFLEAWAVAEGNLEGFDAIGRRLAFSVDRRPQSSLAERLLGPDFGPVHIRLADGVPPDPNGLRRQLAQFLRVVMSEHLSYENMNLSELIQAMAPFIRE